MLATRPELSMSTESNYEYIVQEMFEKRLFCRVSFKVDEILSLSTF